MTKEILVLTEEMTNLSERISSDLTSTLVNLSGSLKGIVCGTHIKIPMDAGYVSYYKSSDNSEKLVLYLRQELLETQKTDAEYQDYLDNYNTDEETINIPKSE